MSIPVTPQRGAFPLAAQKPDPKSDPRASKKVKDAAQQFEGLLLQQVVKVLFESAPGLHGPSASMYQQMFEGPLSEELARAGGIGLRPMLERAIGGHPTGPVPKPSVDANVVPPPSPISITQPSPAPQPIPSDGQASTRIHAAASDLLSGGGLKWSKAGTLQARDLMADPSAAGGSAAERSVRDAHGYQGYYKCNLFALEVARRAGFDVPVVQQGEHVAYPLSNDITRDAADGKVQNDWARVVTGKTAESLERDLRSGQKAFVLSGAGQDGRHGHMAVLERVRSVDYNSHGDIERIVFDGWEARIDGARHLQERTWNAQGHSGGHDARNGFNRIEILELKPGSAGLPRSSRSEPVNNSEPIGVPGSSEPGSRPINNSEDES